MDRCRVFRAAFRRLSLRQRDAGFILDARTRLRSAKMNVRARYQMNEEWWRAPSTTALAKREVMPDRDDANVLELRNVTTVLGSARSRRRPAVTAVAGVDLLVQRQDVVGIVGESGSGKSTLGRTILGIQRETAGEIKLYGQPVGNQAPQVARRVRRAIQYIHQDASAALDPWWSIGHTLAEGLKTNGIKSKAGRTSIVRQSLHAVGLPADSALRFPHELSGGQLRRVGIARILALKPQIVILDEPTAGLDTSVQASVLRLLSQLHREFGLTYLFISHDLSVVKSVCNKVAIMYLGRIVEFADVAMIFAKPLHPYTRALLGAAPTLDFDQTFDETLILGEPPSARARPEGCSFHPRCPFAEFRCTKELPSLEQVEADRQVACWRWREISVPATAGGRAPDQNSQHELT